MTKFAFPLPATPSVAIANSDERFPVRRIFCVGRNYLDHVQEMGNDPKKNKPIFFTKPADTIVEDGAEVDFPMATDNCHFEAELVVAIGTAGVNITEADALDHVFGYAPGNDLTRRDMQNAAKADRAPWDMSKGFDESAIIGAIVPLAQHPHPTTEAITLSVNGDTKQSATLGQLIWSIPEIIAALSAQIALAPGDLIYSGTPSGVGPVVAGDTCTVTVEGYGSVTTKWRA